MVLRKCFYIRWSAGRSPRVHEVNQGWDPSGHHNIVASQIWFGPINRVGPGRGVTIILWFSVDRGLLVGVVGPKPMVPTMPPFFLLGRAVIPGGKKKTCLTSLVWGITDNQCWYVPT